MRFFLISIILCFITPLSFPQSQRSLTDLYGHYLKGLLHAGKGEYLLGLEELEEAKARDPQSIHIRLKIASVLIRLKRLDEAEAVLREAKAIDPENLDISLALIFVYSYGNKNEDLEKEYEVFLKQAHEKKPKDISISVYLAQFYFYKHEPEKAIEIYEKILETNPDYIEAFFWLGFFYEEYGQRNKALDVWEKGRVVDPTFAPILNGLGYTYAEKGIKLDLAEDLVKKALDQDPGNGAYLDSLGWIYFKKGEFVKAKEYIFKAIELIRDPDIYEHLGDIYIKLGDQENAVKYYKEGFLQFPSSKRLKSRIKEYEQKDKLLKK
ncbi:MAG: tetratricopeptide repeat protein [Candidatus Susulua stagnicola]|nr:tetratricopeptide repeat protein [Candidatus Susulua stagnicola]